ncbi:penicillin-binding transpeptidase domain-containing protein [Pseudonocardia asaccharolytica]|uniref:penicillin-binding transpeptidase domain-containing protein n=1 Tax=Pseudonocardia asaccharolytica TaxID=54010 RepID=UPI00041CA288|nr:penicillin-binding transpeptidase domain-containing protein [Pseudonocardia asaccharolytica]
MRPIDPSRGPTRARIVGVGAALLMVMTGCGLLRDDGPQTAAEAFLAAWSRGDDAAAAQLTDNPDAAGALLAEVRTALAPAGLAAGLGQVRTAAEQATASVEVSWDLGEGRRWSYLGELELRPAPEAAAGWEVHWASTVVHPQLAARQRPVLRTDAPEPAPVVDRSGVPLLAPGNVVNVLLDRRAAGDELPAVAGALAGALSPFAPEITTQSIIDGAARVPDGQAYSVAVLRETDFQSVRAAIYDLPGVRFTRQSRLLAPSAGFARQVLPGARTEVAARVDGVAGWSVTVVDAAGATVTTLVEHPPTPGSTAMLSLDRTLQAAAEDAVERLPQQAMLVAVQPSTGDLLAVAQNDPADAAGPLALTGRYPPGSTFKIITALAAVAEDGLTAATPVACPATTAIDGRVVPNLGRFDLGTVPLGRAFARSCNTTFAQLGSRLGADALPAAARTLGLGADYRVPALTTITGSVPQAADPVQRAENGFGQGQVLASPLGMALAAATVAHGAPVVPQLIRGHPTEVLAAPAGPDPVALQQVRSMMRQVVTEGTATRLAGLGEVHGKTGTAEVTNDGRHSHGWFVGYRGDVAFAVLVVDAGSSEPAVGVAERFLGATA